MKVPGNQKYCVSCSCTLVGCFRPKNKSDFCSAHRRVFSSLPWSLQLARCARTVLQELVPSDIIAFLQVYKMLEGHTAACLIAAALAEPTAVFAFSDESVRQGSDKSAESVFLSLQTAVRATAGVPHRAELQQLSRQPEGEFVGVTACAGAFGVIEPCRPASASSPGCVLVLGLRDARFRMAESCPQKLASLVTACSKRHSEVQGLLSNGALPGVIRELRQSVEAINSEAGRPWSENAVASITRKLLMGRLAHGPAQEVDWTEVPFSTLPSSIYQTRGVPEDWSAAAVSDMVTGRDDQGLFVAVWASAFAGCESVLPRDQQLKVIRGGQFRQRLQEFKRAHSGLTPSLVTLLAAEQQAAGVELVRQRRAKRRRAG